MTRALKTVLFINAHSRRGRRYADRAAKDFSRQTDRFKILDVIIVTNLKRLDYHLEVLAATEDLQCVIVGGGDGTIVAVLNALHGREVTYGFLPLGTSNTYMRSLGLPLNYTAAKRSIMAGNKMRASIGAVNGVVFANIAGIGVPAQVTEVTSNPIKRYLGPLAYVVMGLRALVSHQAFYCHVTNDQINEGFYTRYLLFANGKYHGNVPLGRDISAYDDRLVLLAFGVSEKRRHNITAIISVLTRRHEKSPRVKMIPFERLYITTQPKRAIEADGEIIGQTPATVEILPEAIAVFTSGKTKRRQRRR